MPLLDSIGATVKAALALTPDAATPFSSYGGNGSSGAYGGILPFDGNSNNYLPNDLGKEFFAGGNGVVTACSTVVAKAFIMAPAQLEKLEYDDEKNPVWKRVPTHPLIDLLNSPNDHYGADHLWARTLSAEIDGGNGYWRVVMNRARTQPVELWFESNIRPEWTATEFISKYVQRVDGRPYNLAAAANGRVNYRTDYAVHFRYQLDKNNPRLGWSPVQTVSKQILGDNLTSIWQSALLANGAGMSLFVSAKEAKPGEVVDIGKLETLIAHIKRKLRKEGAGGVALSDVPVDVQKVSWSPEEMALDKLITYFESRICSVLEVDPMLIGLASEHKTFSNFEEADFQLWTRNIVPLQERHGSQIESQLFPLFGLDRSEYRLTWDRSGIAALQENLDAKHTRVRSDYEKGIADLEEATAALGYKSSEDMAGVRYQAPKKTEEVQEETADETKSLKIKVDTSKPQKLEPWSDEEKDRDAFDFSEEDVAKAIKSRTPEMQALLEAKK